MAHGRFSTYSRNSPVRHVPTGFSLFFPVLLAFTSKIPPCSEQGECRSVHVFLYHVLPLSFLVSTQQTLRTHSTLYHTWYKYSYKNYHHTPIQWLNNRHFDRQLINHYNHFRVFVLTLLSSLFTNLQSDFTSGIFRKIYSTFCPPSFFRIFH